MDDNFDSKTVRLIITLASPHKYPLVQFDSYISTFYQKVNNFWNNNTNLKHVNYVSIGGGFKDLIVRPDVTFDSKADFSVAVSN